MSATQGQEVQQRHAAPRRGQQSDRLGGNGLRCKFAANLRFKLFSRIGVRWIGGVILLLVLIKDLQAFLDLFERLLCREAAARQRAGDSRVHLQSAGGRWIPFIEARRHSKRPHRSGEKDQLWLRAPISCCSLRSELMTARRESRSNTTRGPPALAAARRPAAGAPRRAPVWLPLQKSVAQEHC